MEGRRAASLELDEEVRPRFLDADTQVSPAPARCIDSCTDTTAVTGPPVSMIPARTPRSRTATVKPWQRSPLRPVRDEDTTTIRPNPLAPISTPSRKPGDRVNRLKHLLRQHRGDYLEVARRGAPAPKASPGQVPREAARLVRQHKADFSTRDDLAARPMEPPRPAEKKERPEPPPLPPRCKPSASLVDHRPWLRRLEPSATPPPPAAAPPQLAALAEPPPAAQTVPQLAALSDRSELSDTQQEPSIPIHVMAPEGMTPAPAVEPPPLWVEPPLPAHEAPAPPAPALAQPLPEPALVRHPLDFVARPADAPELSWSHRDPGQSRQVRTAPPTVRVEPLEFSDSDLFPAPRVDRRRRQAALATFLGLLGTLAVVAAFFLVGCPTAKTGGAIELQSVPPGATVKLNDRTISGTTPVVLNVTDLSQEYEVTLILDGYRVWRDELDLSRGAPRVSVVATLIPKEDPPKDPAQ